MPRAPDRGRVEEPLLLILPSPSPHEAAAIAAALERFVHDSAAARVPRAPGVGGWLQAARLEAVGSEPETPARWGSSGRWQAAVDARRLNP